MNGFLAHPPDREARARLVSLPSETDRFDFHGRELYWSCHTGFSDSKFSGPALEKVLGMRLTVRNVTTVGKLAAKYG